MYPKQILAELLWCNVLDVLCLYLVQGESFDFTERAEVDLLPPQTFLLWRRKPVQ
jgi:hypothetical protein